MNKFKPYILTALVLIPVTEKLMIVLSPGIQLLHMNRYYLAEHKMTLFLYGRFCTPANTFLVLFLLFTEIKGNLTG